MTLGDNAQHPVALHVSHSVTLEVAGRSREVFVSASAQLNGRSGAKVHVFHILSNQDRKCQKWRNKNMSSDCVAPLSPFSFVALTLSEYVMC